MCAESDPLPPPLTRLRPFEHNDFDQYPLWLQFVFIVKAAVAKQQISKFYKQIQRTEAIAITFILVSGLS